MFGCEAFGFRAAFDLARQGADLRPTCRWRRVTVPETMYQAMLDREPQDRHLRPRLHLFRPSGRGRRGAQDAGDLRARAHRRSRPRARRRSSRPGWRRSATHPLVGEARGLGLVGAVELVADKASKRSFDPKAGVGPRAVAFAEEEGLIVRFLPGDVVSICPPLVISEAGDRRPVRPARPRARPNARTGRRREQLSAKRCCRSARQKDSAGIAAGAILPAHSKSLA